MAEPLQDPFKLDSYSYKDEDADGWSSVEESPTVRGARDYENVDYSQGRDLSFLTSANFSTSSFGGDESPSFSRDARRLSVGSLGSPVAQAPSRPMAASARPRPKSALFLADHSLEDHSSPVSGQRYGRARPRSALFSPDNSLMEDQLMSPISSSFKPGSMGSARKNYMAPPIIAPPMTSRSSSPTRSSSPNRTRQFVPKSPSRRSSSPSKNYQPFNFQPQDMMMHNNNSSSSLQVKPAHRKGHKYKHSSVSMNFFQEPPPAQAIEKQLPSLPDMYPVPTFRECLGSLTPSQRLKITWTLVHFSTSIIVFLSGHKISAPELSTIAHFVFYDSLGCLVTVMVDVMSKFEVWSRPSLTYPFGLERLEVLIGFALAASLVMVGLDLLSHSFEEFITMVLHLEGGSHAHHVHREDEKKPLDSVIYFGVLVCTIFVTLITSNYILASEKINTLITSDETSEKPSQSKSGGLLDEFKEKNSRLAAPKKLAKLFTRYPTHMITLSYAFFLVVSPLIAHIASERLEVDINEVASLFVSLVFSLTGWKLVQALGGILLLSYPSSDYDYHALKDTITQSIQDLDSFRSTYSIDKFFISKFSYELFVIGMKIGMSGGNSDDEARIRFEINRLIKRSLESQNLTTSNTEVEITIDIDRL